MGIDTRRATRRHRLALAAAAAGVLPSGAITAASLGGAPATDVSGADLQHWLIDNRDAVRWSVWASTIGLVPFLTLVALLKDRLPAPHADLFGFGAVTVATTGAVQSWFWAGMVFRPEAASPAALRLAMDIAIHWGPVLTGSMITMIAPVTLLALAGRAGLPRWLGWVGLIAGAEQAIETATVFGFQGFAAPGGAMNMQLGAALTLGWTLAFAFSAARAEASPD